MKIYLDKIGQRLQVFFSRVKLADRHLSRERLMRCYKTSRGIKFVFEKNAQGLYLYISFDDYKDASVISRLSAGQFIAELQLLWEIAHLQSVRIFTANVSLHDGRTVELMETVGFRLQKVEKGLWESEGDESEVRRRSRQIWLNRLEDGMPGLYKEVCPNIFTPGDPNLARAKTIFVDKVKRIKHSPVPLESVVVNDKSHSKPVHINNPGITNTLDGKEPEISISASLKQEGPDVLAHCDGCEELYHECELTEFSPGVFLCALCYTLRKGFKKPTARDINKAIQLLLWRCRDAEIHKGTAKGKRGFYELDDWIAKADDLMIYELGMWCADIQELNIGTRDS